MAENKHGHGRGKSHGDDYVKDHNHDHNHDHCSKQKRDHSHRSMGDHSHDHGHHHHHIDSTSNIAFAFLLNFVFSLIELTGGLVTGSMSIVAGAVHDLGDAISLGTAWVLEKVANKRRDKNFNFGYRRFSLLSALIAGVVISTGSLMIVFESIKRLREPGEGQTATAMIVFAIIGLAMNGIAAWRLSRGSTQNEKMLTWHSIEDLAGWTVVLVGGIVVALTGILWIDPILAIGLSIFVFFNVLRHLKDTVYLFLQGRPPNFSEKEFLTGALAVNGVEHVDHLAVWSLDGYNSILSARLHLHNLRDPNEIEKVKSLVRSVAAKQRAIATLETCLADSVEHGEDGN